MSDLVGLAVCVSAYQLFTIIPDGGVVLPLHWTGLYPFGEPSYGWGAPGGRVKPDESGPGRCYFPPWGRLQVHPPPVDRGFPRLEKCLTITLVVFGSTTAIIASTAAPSPMEAKSMMTVWRMSHHVSGLFREIARRTMKPSPMVWRTPCCHALCGAVNHRAYNVADVTTAAGAAGCRSTGPPRPAIGPASAFWFQ